MAYVPPLEASMAARKSSAVAVPAVLTDESVRFWPETEQLKTQAVSPAGTSSSVSVLAEVS